MDYRVLYISNSENNPWVILVAPHRNPITINPLAVIRKSCLGPCLCPRDSEAFPSNPELGAYNPLLSAEWASEEAPQGPALI